MKPNPFYLGVALISTMAALIYLWDICTGRLRRYLRVRKAKRAGRKALKVVWKGRGL